MPKPATLNRFPLFGLFAHQAARHMRYSEDDACLLGYSTALLYAIFLRERLCGRIMNLWRNDRHACSSRNWKRNEP